MNNLGRRSKMVSSILDISAGIMAMLALFSTYNSYKYISGLVAKGLEISDQLIEVINVFVNAISPYVFYAVCLFGIGHLVKLYAYKEQIIEEDTNDVIEFIDEMKFLEEDKNESNSSIQ